MHFNGKTQVVIHKEFPTNFIKLYKKRGCLQFVAPSFFVKLNFELPKSGKNARFGSPKILLKIEKPDKKPSFELNQPKYPT